MSHVLRGLSLALLVTCVASAQDVEAPAGPPPTARELVEETLHGERVVDPYRWLEGDGEGNPTERTTAWTHAHRPGSPGTKEIYR